MKLNKYLLLGTLLLLGIGLVLGGCGKKDNPFEPKASISNVNAGNMYDVSGITITPALDGIMTDIDGDINNSIQGEVTIIFPKYMNVTSVYNQANIVFNPAPDTLKSWTYYADIRKLVINATWANNKWYRVTLKAGLLSQAGLPLDGNGNDKQDGSPYDDVRSYFATGAPAAALEPSLNHPLIFGYSGTTLYYGPTGGGINRWPYFWLDINTLKIDTTLVKANLIVRNSSNVQVPIGNAIVANVGGGHYRYYFTPLDNLTDSLTFNQLYTVTFHVANIRDTTRDSNYAVWGQYKYMANIPNMAWTFMTLGSGTGDYTPLDYTGGTPPSGNKEFVVSFDDTVKMSTVNTSTVKVFQVSGTSLVSQVNIYIYQLPSDVTRFRVVLGIPANSPVKTYKLFLSKEIMDIANLKLDGNGNGLGGENADPSIGLASDDVWTGAFTY